METVLITGCAGFIGSQLSKTLLQKNSTVIGIDNFNHAYNPKFKKHNISILTKNKNFHFHTIDITQKTALQKLFKKYSIQKIIHLAARAGIRKSIRYPQLYRRVNIEGTKILYSLAQNHDVKQFIFASSSSVYGNSKKIPFQESMQLPTSPSPYAKSKHDAEKILASLYKKKKIPTTILRFFSVYGPHGRPDMAPYLFTQAILNNQTITQFGDGTSARDYTYISDITNGIVKVLEKVPDFEVYNLGNHYPVTLNSLIETIEKITKKKMARKILPPRKEESEKTWADITKAQNQLSWKPEVAFESGMKEFITWFKKNRM